MNNPPELNLLNSVTAASVTRIHFVGIAGTGMKCLASHLASLGVSVTGSDLALTADQSWDLRQLGILVYAGHQGIYVTPGLDFLVYSPAIPAQNPERLKATQLGIPQYSYPEMLAKITAAQKLITVAGTNGKSSTTAMLGWIFHEAEHPATLIFGGELQQDKTVPISLESKIAIIEACEYQRHFLHYHPTSNIILNVEHDHFESYPEYEDSLQGFSQFALQTAPGGYLLISADQPKFVELTADFKGQRETFSLKHEADWEAKELLLTNPGYQFSVYYQGNHLARVQLQIPGHHQVGNALAAFAASYHHHVPVNKIVDGLASFPGVQRRFEYRGLWRGVTLIDDYAHHPSAVSVTLETARGLYPDRKIWCVFQPHQARRLQELMSEFVDSFDLADEVIITPIFAAREERRLQTTPLIRELADRLQIKQQSARVTSSLDQVLLLLEDGCQSGDIVLFLGAGDCDRIPDELIRKISRNYAS